jgi:hypothetical protein
MKSTTSTFRDIANQGSKYKVNSAFLPGEIEERYFRGFGAVG